jgi:hypothetical protein
MWALIHLNCTRLFPATMSADQIGVSTTNVHFWLTPWRRVDEHLPLTHIAEVTHIRGFFLGRDQRREFGRAQSVARVFGVAKPSARDFVEHVRARLNGVGPAVTHSRRQRRGSFTLPREAPYRACAVGPRCGGG